MIDLHLHLDGSLTPGEILHLARLAGLSLPQQNAAALRPLLEAEPDCQSLGAYLQKFDLPLQVLQTEETLALAVYFLLKRLSSQGLCYAEIRFAPQLHLSLGLTQSQVTTAAVAGLQKGIADFGMPAQLILCCMRGSSNREVNLETVRTAKTHLGKGVCAVDLAGNEAAYSTEDFAEVFSLAKDLGLPFTIHAGEAAGPESIQQALKLGANRIGHGIHAIEDADLLAQLSRQQIPLELCFTSNLQTKAVNCAQAYPICRLLELGIPVTVNTDNMTVSGTCLHREYTRLQEAFGLAADTLQAIACNAAAAAFVSQDQAAELKKQITEGFASWLRAPVKE